MKTEDYKIDYYREMLSCAFEEAGVLERWTSLTFAQELTIIETVIGGVDQQSMAFGYVDTRGDNYEVTQLKKQLAEAKKDSQEWQNAFTTNVKRRHPNWDKHEICVSKDGNAELR